MLHLGAAGVLLAIVALGDADMSTTTSFDPIIESGTWALRLLLLCLLMTPLAFYLGWSAAAALRKPFGLWAFGFALVHVGYSLAAGGSLGRWQAPQPYLLLGALSLLILTALALTSYKAAMRRLGRWWKRLHRLVYIAGGATVAHAILAAATSKRLLARDPQAVYEAQLAAALLVLLLVARIPAVRRLLQPVLAPLRLRRERAAKVPAVPPESAPQPLVPAPSPAPLPDSWRPPLEASEAHEEEELVGAR
jgi:sulfoxide reductase heme-binding subunit YedZ